MPITYSLPPAHRPQEPANILKRRVPSVARQPGLLPADPWPMPLTSDAKAAMEQVASVIRPVSITVPLHPSAARVKFLSAAAAAATAAAATR